MHRIAMCLAELRRMNRKAFAPFVMAGYPDLRTSERLIRDLAALGADLIEVGLPFSDPLADGPVIQSAAQTALMNGMTFAAALESTAALAGGLSCPLVLFTYLNPLIQRGIKPAIARIADAGFAGLIVPDLPPEAAPEIRAESAANGLDLNFLVAPTSVPARIQAAAEASTGFLYAVSVRGVTGARTFLPPDLPAFLARIRMETDRPALVGFGISTPEQAREAAAMADGVITASALIRLIGTKGPEAAIDLAAAMRRAVT